MSAACPAPHTAPAISAVFPARLARGRIPGAWALWLLPLPVLVILLIAGCGEPQRLIDTVPEDPRGGSAREIEAAALYASGLQQAWNHRFGHALADLHQADRLAPNQPLVLAAIGFALDGLAHPEETPPPGVPANPPATAPIHHGELTADAFEYLHRASQLHIDDARVYERLAAHWYRLSKNPPTPPPGTENTPAVLSRLKKEAELNSAQYSLMALRYLAANSASDLARQKSLVYINHLGKYYRQHGRLEEELAVVRIHRTLEPDDLALQLDEIELLFLTRRVDAAEAHLAAFQGDTARPDNPPAVPAAAPITGGPLQRRLQAARALGRRVQGALRTDSSWPHNPGDPASTSRSPHLRWINEPEAGLIELWDLFWRDFNRAQPANPLVP